jgi:hypothetical protein
MDIHLNWYVVCIDYLEWLEWKRSNCIKSNHTDWIVYRDGLEAWCRCPRDPGAWTGRSRGAVKHDKPHLHDDGVDEHDVYSTPKIQI